MRNSRSRLVCKAAADSDTGALVNCCNCPRSQGSWKPAYSVSPSRLALSDRAPSSSPRHNSRPIFSASIVTAGPDGPTSAENGASVSCQSEGSRDGRNPVTRKPGSGAKSGHCSGRVLGVRSRIAEMEPASGVSVIADALPNQNTSHAAHSRSRQLTFSGALASAGFPQGSGRSTATPSRSDAISTATSLATLIPTVTAVTPSAGSG